ncbi:MAG: alkaline phosphatase family protein, partial [Deltaproteobacteria bacterium]|nr:alkaline phosphatase family protein [Deltaproteobacteria bacterium]
MRHVTDSRRRGLVALTVCVAALVACVRGFFSPVVPVLPEVIESPSPRLASRVLWIVVDGLRHDTALESGWMPQLEGLARRGASGTAMTTAITMTGVGVRAMSTGMSPSLADLARNWSLPRVTDDNLFARIKARGGRAVALGNETWFQLFPDMLAKATNRRPGIIKFASPVNGFDRFLTKRALELAGDKSWELAVLHFGGVDNASHMWTPSSEKFHDKITEIDTDLGRIAAEMGPHTTLLITSDHGTSDRGHHGGIDPVERRTPLVLVGPGIRRGASLDARQVDLPATVAALLGLQVSAPVEGRALVEALDLTLSDGDALIASEARRHDRYANAYATQFSEPPRPAGVELADWLATARARWLAPLLWALAMIAAAAWLFGLSRGAPRVERWLSLAIVIAAIGSAVVSVAPVPLAAIALVGLLVPLLPWLDEVRHRLRPTTLVVIALAAAQTAALL